MDRSAVLLFTVQLLLVVYEVLTQVVWFYGVDDVKVPEERMLLLFCFPWVQLWSRNYTLYVFWAAKESL